MRPFRSIAGCRSGRRTFRCDVSLTCRRPVLRDGVRVPGRVCLTLRDAARCWRHERCRCDPGTAVSAAFGPAIRSCRAAGARRAALAHELPDRAQDVFRVFARPLREREHGLGRGAAFSGRSARQVRFFRPHRMICTLDYPKEERRKNALLLTFMPTFSPEQDSAAGIPSAWRRRRHPSCSLPSG